MEEVFCDSDARACVKHRLFELKKWTKLYTEDEVLA